MSVELGSPIDLKRHFMLIVTAWSVVMVLAMGYDFYTTWNKSRDMAVIQARTAIARAKVFRAWNAEHGGVYAAIDKKTRPNPFLHVPERDITTPSGRRLTLINPNYMMRQAGAIEKETGGIITHLTSLRPLRPENGPDQWERQALEAFEEGKTEVSEMVNLDDGPYFRLMQPLFVKKACLKCHGAQGYKEGDIRGGISVMVPMAQLKALEYRDLASSGCIYLFFWAAGLVLLCGGFVQLRRQLEQRQRIEEELKSFKTTLDSTHDAVMFLETPGMRIFYVNYGAERLYGLGAESIVGIPFPELLPEGEREKFQRVADSLEGNQMESSTLETRFIKNDCTEVPVEITLQFIDPGKGKPRFLAIVRDISLRIQAEREKEKMAARLLNAQKMESIGQLAAGIAHEINTPIQYIGSNMEFLQEACDDLLGIAETAAATIREVKKGSSPCLQAVERLEQALDEADWDYLKEEIPEALEQSREGVVRVTSIVRAMKEFSHPGSGGVEPADINGLIETTVMVARNEWKYVAEVRLELDPSLPEVPCRRDEMGQVILNLLVNAANAIEERLKAEGREGDKGTIEIRTTDGPESVEIVVSDDGTGMGEEILDKIFDPFFTTKEVGRGTGQGLTIAYDIVVNRHGGTIEVSSEPGRGSRFVIRLPKRQQG